MKMYSQKNLIKLSSYISNLYLLAPLFLFIFILTTKFVPSYAIEYGGVGGRPGNPRLDEPRSESIFIHTVDGGDIIPEVLKVINNTSLPKTLLVYSADYTSSTDGGFACKQLGEAKTGVGSWLSLDKDEVVLAPNTNELLNFNINIPDNVSPGEHNGCILIQEKVTNKNESGISLALRTGMRVLLTVKGEIIKSLELLSFNVLKNKNNNNYFLIPEVANNGNVSVMSDVKVYVYNVFNKKVTEFGGEYSVLKDETTRWNFEFNQPFWGGYFKTNAVIKYDNNGDQILNSSYIWFFIPPTTKALWILAFAIIPLVTLLFISLIRVIILKRNRKTWITYIVKKDESIVDIANKFHVKWNKLSKVNKLNPPYTLKEGDKILVPGDTPNAKKGKSKK